MTLERISHSSPAYDKRDPDPRKNYGVHGLELIWVVTDHTNAVSFTLYTNWQLPHVRAETFGTPLHEKPHSSIVCQPMPADLGFHRSEPLAHQRDPDDAFSQDDCSWLKGGCYYDGTTTGANVPFEQLVAEGLDGLWGFLETEHRRAFP